MAESVLFNNPIVITGFIIALALHIFSAIKKTHFAVKVLAAVIFVGTLIYALLTGMELYEAGAVAAVFMIVGLLPLWKREK